MRIVVCDEVQKARVFSRDFILKTYEAQVDLYMRMGREAIEAGEIDLAKESCFDAIVRLSNGVKHNLSLIG